MKNTRTSKNSFNRWMMLSILLFFAIILNAVAEKQAVQAALPESSSSELTITSILLDGEWKFILDPEDVGLSKKYNETGLDDKKWINIKVPQGWEEQGITTANPYFKDTEFNNPYDGFAWYRKHITIPNTWNKETVFLQLGKIDDWDWAYWNGTLIGHVGQENQYAYQAQRVYAIPPDKILPGKENVLSVRVCDKGGIGGIYEGPVQLDYGKKPDTASTPSNEQTSKKDVVRIGESITIKADEIITGDVVSVGGSVTVDGKVYGDVVSVGGTVSVHSTAEVRGDTVAVGGKLNIQTGAKITGQQVSVGGFNMDLSKWIGKGSGIPFMTTSPWTGYLIDGLTGLGFALFFILMTAIAALLFPNKLEIVKDTIIFKPGISFIKGFVGLILLIPITVILAITCIGIPLIPIFWVAYILAALFGYAAIGLYLGKKINDAFVWNVQSTVGLTLLGIVPLEILSLIPFIGGCFEWIIIILIITFGIGSVIDSKFGNKPVNGNSGPNHIPPVPPVRPVPPTVSPSSAGPSDSPIKPEIITDQNLTTDSLKKDPEPKDIYG